MARAALERARLTAVARQRETERGDAARRRAATRAANMAQSGVSAARRTVDDDEPVALGAALTDLLDARGWQGEAAVARVTADWERTVGPDIAAHCRPVSLRDGVLTVEAETTAWATQIRLLSRPLLARIVELAGPGTVQRLTVHGPAGPSWTHGRLRVPGRGPRDTYG